MTAMPHAFIGGGKRALSNMVLRADRSLARSLALALPEQSAHRRPPRQRWREGLARPADDSDSREEERGWEGNCKMKFKEKLGGHRFAV